MCRCSTYTFEDVFGHVDTLSWTCQSQGRWLTRCITGRQKTHHRWSASRKLWSVESLRLPTGTKSGNDIIVRLEERGAERGSSRRSSSKGREKAIVNQTNIGTVEGRGGANMSFPERMDSAELTDQFSGTVYWGVIWRGKVFSEFTKYTGHCALNRLNQNRLTWW